MQVRILLREEFTGYEFTAPRCTQLTTSMLSMQFMCMLLLYGQQCLHQLRPNGAVYVLPQVQQRRNQARRRARGDCCRANASGKLLPGRPALDQPLQATVLLHPLPFKATLQTVPSKEHCSALMALEYWLWMLQTNQQPPLLGSRVPGPKRLDGSFAL